jgi:hypothetical protein
MAGRTHIPGSPACGQWETLLIDALDGRLSPEDEATFAAHRAACAACAVLYEEAKKGREWLEFLSPEPEVPAGLLEKILAHTGPGHAKTGEWTIGQGPLPAPAGSAAIPAFVPPVWQQPGFFARMRDGMPPRLLMTFAMAFFSIALTLNLTGVRLTSLRPADLRPRILRSYMERQLTMASVPIVRYYDHLRFVYEVESRVRELRSDSEEENREQQQRQIHPGAPGQTKENPGKEGGFRVNPRQGPSDSETGPGSQPYDDGPGGILETSLSLSRKKFGGNQVDDRSVFSRGSAMQAQERSARWTA